MYLRESSVIDAYNVPYDWDTWLPCPHCKQRPYIWEFDNGRFAKCCCSAMYESLGKVRAESLNSCYNRTGDLGDYDRNDLLKTWNNYVETGIVVTLEEGRW